MTLTLFLPPPDLLRYINARLRLLCIYIQILYINLYCLHQLHQVKVLVSANLLGNKLVSDSDVMKWMFLVVVLNGFSQLQCTSPTTCLPSRLQHKTHLPPQTDKSSAAFYNRWQEKNDSRMFFFNNLMNNKNKENIYMNFLNFS